MIEKLLFNWSTGKDSAMALHALQNQYAHQYKIHSLLTTVNAEFDRVSMHGVRTELLQQQAKQLNLPLHIMQMPSMPSMEAYDEAMKNTMLGLKKEGYTASAFGDIFLEDLKKYREDKLQSVGIKAVFPLWQQNTTQLLQQFVQLGFKAVITCVNSKYLPQSFAGKIIDEHFLSSLPNNVDPCGENGEYHSFVFEGPIFKQPIAITTGELVYKQYQPAANSNNNCFNKEDDVKPFDTGFWYCDILPKI